MSRIVMKFGGTSVADLDRIRNVAGRVKREVEAGHEVAVVVSAMAGVTNQLVKWCQDLSPLHDAREYDTVVATGEQVTIGLLAIALQGVGVDARSWQGWQVPIRTDDMHGKARIQEIDGAANPRVEMIGREAGDRMDARPPRRQRVPIVLLADAERGDDANAGHGNDRPSEVVFHNRHS